MTYYQGQGDYYMGIGDPGLKDWIKKGIGAVAGVVRRTTPIGAIAGVAYDAFKPKAKPRYTQPAITPRLVDIARQPPRIQRGIGGTTLPRAGGGGGTQLVMRKKYRRMNVTNPKALRRAIRRQAGFVKLARKALQGTGYTITSRSSRKRAVTVSEHGPGSVHIR